MAPGEHHPGPRVEPAGCGGAGSDARRRAGGIDCLGGEGAERTRHAVTRPRTECATQWRSSPRAHSAMNFAMSSPIARESLISLPSESPPPSPMTPILRCANVASVLPLESLTTPVAFTDDLPAPNPPR